MQRGTDMKNFKIYSIYSDNMLIQQNKPFVIAGIGKQVLLLPFRLKGETRQFKT